MQDCLVFEAKESYKARLWRGEGVGETEKKREEVCGRSLYPLLCLKLWSPCELLTAEGQMFLGHRGWWEDLGRLGQTGFHCGGGLLIWGRKKVWRDRHKIA